MGILPTPPRDVGRLALRIKLGESIRIITADGTLVTVTRINKGRLRFDAPLSAKILRGSVIDRRDS